MSSVLLPYPRACAEAYRMLERSRGQVHPSYPLARMVAWYEGWKRSTRGGRESVSARAFGQAEVALKHARLKQLAEAARGRRAAWLDPLRTESVARLLRLTARTDAVVWLVSQGPLELGLALHHVYGFPVLPGSSLKGLARRATPGKDGARRYGNQEQAGSVAILDGLPCEGWTVRRDVMTPHFSQWYQGGPVAPDDTENPIPIPFLSVAAGTHFEVALVARDRDGARHLDEVTEDIRRGLEERGLGAKTAAGYGVFTVDLVPPGRPEKPGEAGAQGTPAPVETGSLTGLSPEAGAVSQAIKSLRPADVKPRLAGLVAQIERCPVDERPAVAKELGEQIRKLGFKGKEIREFVKRYPVLASGEGS